MTVELVHETWPGRIVTTTIGATAAEGGTRSRTITIGGHGALPFQPGDAPSPHRPVVALEVVDAVPSDWPEHLRASLGDVLGSPADWARKGVEEFGADLICLRLFGTHPDVRDTSPDAAAATVRAVLDAVDVPLIVLGCGHPDKDNDVWPRITEAARGEKCLVGVAVPENYKTLVVACLADGHSIVAEGPIDVNIQKQLTILITAMGLPPERVVMHPGTASLGYGLEYEYSIMERIRLAGLQGDRMLAQPVMTIVGEEAWRAKEARLDASAMPAWGDAARRGPAWEATTAAAFLQSGTDIVVLVHPEALAATRRTIDQLAPVALGA
ncbi:MAG TPA: acetyl-CoA decarbonylase/synthase complex subunit delta [Candidatus Sulfomarinibacteraceae bacterium]|nr:acetyl-CoA decarbonylase/synthase complex subunit delta [Candidatus Sulfomarinibacteraceae bacterium]